LLQRHCQLPAIAQFKQEAKLVATDAIGASFQGYSSALSWNGNTALVGGPSDASGRGAAWVFERSRGKWTQQTKLVATDPSCDGRSVTLSSSGNTAIIVRGPGGAACIFQRSFDRKWKQQAELVPTGTPIDAGYSASISGDGNTAIIGAPFANGEIGAGFVFVRRHGMWNQQAELVGTDVTGPFSTQGTSVALSGDGNTAVVGGFNDNNTEGFPVGAAWVFERSHDVWRQQAKLVGTGFVGAPMQGYSVSISDDGNTVIVGGPLDNLDAGAAWVFTRSYGVWSQQGPKLVGTDVIGPFQLQGNSVSLSSDGNTAVSGGFADDNNMGAAWVFTRSDGVWNQKAKLVGTGAIFTPGSLPGGVEQGTSVAISGDGSTVLSGGPEDNDGVGAAWIFRQHPVFAGSPEEGNCYGKSVSALVPAIRWPRRRGRSPGVPHRAGSAKCHLGVLRSLMTPRSARLDTENRHTNSVGNSISRYLR
jgi:FG-GAP repeat